MNIKKEIKKFYEWTKLKIRLNRIFRTPNIKEGEVWWAAVGKNIGIEINGKHRSFSRPVIIFRKFGSKGFLAIPTTTQPHDGSWYVPIRVANKDTRAVLSQPRTMSTSRLYKKLGTLSEEDFIKIREGFKDLCLENK